MYLIWVIFVFSTVYTVFDMLMLELYVLYHDISEGRQEDFVQS